MAFDRVLAERRQLLDQGSTAVPGERRRDADVIELAGVVVQPEEERPDVRAGTVLVPAEAGHDAVGRSLVLDLEQGALARLVRGVESFRDDAIEAGSLETVEPVGRRGAVGRPGGGMARRGYFPWGRSKRA